LNEYDIQGPGCHHERGIIGPVVAFAPGAFQDVLHFVIDLDVKILPSGLGSPSGRQYEVQSVADVTPPGRNRVGNFIDRDRRDGSDAFCRRRGVPLVAQDGGYIWNGCRPGLDPHIGPHDGWLTGE